MSTLSRPVSRSSTVRTLRWICWAANLACWLLIPIKGFDRHHNPYARIEWLGGFFFSTASILLDTWERSHRKSLSATTEAS